MTSEQSSASRKQVTLILAIPIVVIALSSLLFVLAQKNVLNFGTVNRGSLIQPPVQLGELKPARLDGSEFMFDTPESLWLFMVVGGRDCRDACERMLYLTRQTHVALGKKMGRVERIYLATDGPLSPQLRDFIEAEHSDMTVVYADGSDFVGAFQQLPSSPLDARSFYIVDPLGWVMMVYRAADTETDTLTTLGKDVLKDMRRLLK
ncbi:hypothetical protein [Spongiibacter sp.]|uniref:hypothetical protein n=1 Tax=Spongiibacter sp. TaxID=2024860 RepID=UPI003561C7EA